MKKQINPSKLLQAALDKRRVTQSQLARHIGVMPHVINSLCSGRRNMSDRIILLISDALKLDPQKLAMAQMELDLFRARKRLKKKIDPICARASSANWTRSLKSRK